MKKSFLVRHPFVKTLLKIAAVIVISFGTFVASVLSLILFLSFVALFSSFGSDDLEIAIPKSYAFVFGNRKSDNRLLSIPIAGVILGEKEVVDPLSFLDVGIVYGYEVKKTLYEAADDDTISGVILEVNSPGGTIFGSRAIADGVTYYKEKTGKPVIAIISGLGASGGYYAISSTDQIVADYGSTIGSIGVLMGPFKYYNDVVSEDGGILLGGVVTQNGIETTYFTGGTSKDLGNPYRQLTQREREILQEQINNEYGLFVEYVSKHRNISESDLRNQIGALIYDNTLATEFKLIDATINKESAYADLAKRAGLGLDDYVVIREQTQPTFLEALLQARTPKVEKTSVLCPLSSTILAYHGSVTELCNK